MIKILLILSAVLFSFGVGAQTVPTPQTDSATGYSMAYIDSIPASALDSTYDVRVVFHVTYTNNIYASIHWELQYAVYVDVTTTRYYDDRCGDFNVPIILSSTLGSQQIGVFGYIQSTVTVNGRRLKFSYR